MRPTCLISDQDGRQFAYNRAGRLSEVKHQGRTIAHYTYNALSQRTAKQTDHRTTLYQYDQTGNLLGESTPAGIPLRDYVYRDTLPVAQIHHRQGSDGRGAQPFAGEHHSTSVGCPYAGGWLPHGALRRRLCRAMRKSGPSPTCAARDTDLDGTKRPQPAPGQDPRGRLPDRRTRLRVPWLPLRVW